MTQKADLYDYLEKHGKITRLEAFLELGITELASRILELEADGWLIPRRSVEVVARNGRKVKVMQYRTPVKIAAA